MAVLDIKKDLDGLFRAQVQKTPNLVALEDGVRAWSYEELDAEVNTLAQRLQSYRVTRDSLVGILLERSANYVIGCLAALRAGGAFLVLELAYPPDLLTDVILDAQPAVILTHQAHAARVQGVSPLIVLDGGLATLRRRSDVLTADQVAKLPSVDETDLDKLAFVSYTSGTTGKPKGIANPHRAPVRSYDLRFGVSDLKSGDKVACNVFFVWEILRPLVRGATTVVVPDEVSYDATLLVDLLAAKKATETLMTPTLLAAILARDHNVGKRLPELRTLWLNGEVVTTDLARRASKALPNTRLLNCYSISETHEVACGDIREMMSAEASYCPVGPPIDPKHTYILDVNEKQVEVGAVGELFVGGHLLAREYINLPETTAKSFLSDPFSSDPHARMYRTGDAARLVPSGCLEITGRVGGMLKIRGYSVVPAKVETAIMEQLAVSHCAVTSDGDGLERQLVAYIVHDAYDTTERVKVNIDPRGFSPTSRKALNESLAHYMVPAVWIALDELPSHVVSGKVDLKRLPKPADVYHESAQVAANGTTPHDPELTEKIERRGTNITREAITDAWAAAIKIPASAVTPEHTFFDLGGHSLSLANLAGKLSKMFGYTIPLTLLAGDPTLAGHLQIVKNARDGHIAAVQADLPAALRDDSLLAEDIKPKGDLSYCRLSEARTILLTGATGFLGAFLLQGLLERTSARVVCIVRFPKPSTRDRARGMARIRRNLLDFGLWSDATAHRIEIIPGNLSRPHLGLTEEVFQDLAKRTDVIIHAGATVNLVYPYAALRDANVGGTREILRLACSGGATIHHISTNGVLPGNSTGWSENEMTQIEDVPTKIADGYGQTKWVAENLVNEAIARGLPATIIRPGTISGHSQTGATNAWDLFSALLVESLHIGFAPQVNGWRAEMTPVDIVSNGILDIAENGQARQQTFHIGDPDPVPTANLFKCLKDMGFPTQPISWDDWLKEWQEKRGNHEGGEGAFTVDILKGGMPTIEFLTDISVLKDDALRSLLGDFQRPAIDAKLMETYAHHWFARGWLSQPPALGTVSCISTSQRKGRLVGKVAFVTGASSGIGSAVATALAKEGAHVMITARRVNELKTLEAQIASSYGHTGVKVIFQPTDVVQRDQVEAAVKRTETELGPIDILVCCAGVMYFTMMHNTRIEEWDRTVDVNCKGLLNCLSTTLPSMLARKTGHVIAISSDAGRKVFPGLGVYSGSKFFVEATLQALRLETANTGLRVTSVQPGNVATDLLGLSSDPEALEKYGTPSGAKVLEPCEVANAIVFAVCQPEHVAVNEVLIEPREEPA